MVTREAHVPLQQPEVTDDRLRCRSRAGSRALYARQVTPDHGDLDGQGVRELRIGVCLSGL
jgi:hypothetical protein